MDAKCPKCKTVLIYLAIGVALYFLVRSFKR